MSTVPKAKAHLFASTAAAATAHQQALARHREHLKKLKQERELREAEATAAIIHDDNA